MFRLGHLLLLLSCLAAPAWGQNRVLQWKDLQTSPGSKAVTPTEPLPVVPEGGGSVPGAGSQPYNYGPLNPDQHNLAIVSSTALTLPSGVLQAVVCANGNAVNYTWDGATTPTASVGLSLANGQCIQFSGPLILANLRFIQAAATATLNVTYTNATGGSGPPSITCPSSGIFDLSNVCNDVYVIGGLR